MQKSSNHDSKAILAIIDQASPKTLQEQLAAYHPSDVAEVFSKLDETRREFVLLSLNFHQLANLFTHLDAKTAARCAAAIKPDKVAHILETMPPDDAAHILNAMSKSSQSNVYDHLDGPRANTLQSLTKYRTSTAGALMTSDYVTLDAQLTAKEALAELINSTESLETIHRIYVLGENKFLEGVVELRALIQADDEERLSSLMHGDVITVQVEDHLDYVIRLIQNYHLYQLPIVDKQYRLLGIITMDDAVALLWRKTRRTYAVQGGLSTKMPLGISVGRRLPWLLGISTLAFMLSVLLINLNLPHTAHIHAVMILPFVLGMMGQTVMQSQACTVRALQVGRLPDSLSRFFHILREGISVAIQGLLYGVMFGVFLTALWLISNHALFSVSFIFYASFVTFAAMVLAGVIGSLVPVVLYHFNLNPIWGSGLLLKGCIDFPITLVLFLTVGYWV